AIPTGAREALVVVLRVHQDGQPGLFGVAGAGSLVRLLPRLGKDREEDGRQDGDDRNNHQQLDQRKATRVPFVSSLSHKPSFQSMPPWRGSRSTMRELNVANAHWRSPSVPVRRVPPS